MSSPTSVSISDDLPSSQASVSSRSTNDEQVAGVEHVPSVDEPLLRDCVLDDVIDEVLSELIVGNVGVVLCADEDGVDSYWCDEVTLFFVLHCNLHLSVWTHPVQDFLLPALLQSPYQSTREVVAEGHEVLSLIRGVSDHQSLVSSTHLLFGLVEMHALGNIGRLLVNSHDDGGIFVIHADIIGVITDLLDGLSRNLLKINLSIHRNLSENHANGVLDGTLACNFSVGILGEAGIEH